MAEDKLFVEATEEDVPSIIGLRQRILEHHIPRHLPRFHDR